MVIRNNGVYLDGTIYINRALIVIKWQILGQTVDKLNFLSVRKGFN